MPTHAPPDTAPCPARRTLAPALLALALSACGAGTPRTDGTPASGAASGGVEAKESTSLGSATADTGAGEDVDVAVGETPAPTSAPASAPEASPQASPEAEPIDEPDAGSEEAADPAGCDASTATMQRRALELVNAFRAEARVCGSAGRFAATAPLGWDSRLEAAAATHSADMAASGVFSHTGGDGSSVGDRIERAGYVWGEYAENIAAGQQSLEAAVAGWIDSPGHCRNLMAPGVRDVAVACVANEEDRFRFYWTNVFARSLGNGNRP